MVALPPPKVMFHNARRQSLTSSNLCVPHRQFSQGLKLDKPAASANFRHFGALPLIFSAPSAAHCRRSLLQYLGPILSGYPRRSFSISSTPILEVHMRLLSKPHFAAFLLALLIVPALYAGNGVLGQIDLVGATKVEETSGVWIDGQYVGYLGELKGSKKLLLLPGEHEITVRQGGYLDFTQKVQVRAGETQTIEVKLEKDTRVQLPRITAEIKLKVNPDRAAVFVDGVFVGHVAEFGGMGRALLVAPGKRKITISLPGYQTFETDIEMVANQKSMVKTELVKGGPAEGTPLPQQN
jgi:hypothetical protein